MPDDYLAVFMDFDDGAVLFFSEKARRSPAVSASAALRSRASLDEELSGNGYALP